MTGIVQGYVELSATGTYEVKPARCAVEDEHRPDIPVCFKVYHDALTRACPYWHATTNPGNYCNREHPSALRTRAVENGSRMTACLIVCHAQKRNRPPGA